MGILEEMAGVPNEPEQTTTSEETMQTTQTDEPEKTTHEAEPEKSTETVNEEGTEITQESDPLDPEGIKKALKDTKAALTKLQQENAARLKKDESSQFEIEKAKVSEQERQLAQSHQQKINQLKQGKSQLIAQESQRLDNLGYTPGQKSQMMAQFNYNLDNEYDSLKSQYEAEHKTSIDEIKQKQQEFNSKQIQQNHDKAEESLKDKLSNPVMKQIWEDIKSKGYPHPQDIVDNILPIFEKAIKDHQETLSKEFQLNKERDKAKNKEPRIGGTHAHPAGTSKDDVDAFMKLAYRKK
jgi:hypothetical protein